MPSLSISPLTYRTVYHEPDAALRAFLAQCHAEFEQIMAGTYKRPPLDKGTPVKWTSANKAVSG